METSSHDWLATSLASRLFHSTQKPRFKRSQRGYTFPELVVVLLICSLLTAAALPRYTETIFQYRVDAAAKRIAADIDFIRRQAFFTSKSQSIKFEIGGGQANTYAMVTAKYINFAAIGTTVDLNQDPYRAVIVSSTLGGKTITFDQYGMPNSGGNVVVQVATYSKTIVVDASTGRVTIQ